jgi:N-formylglutamate amidohydrolase
MTDDLPSLILHIAHSATAIPEDVRKTILLSDAELAGELLGMTDHFTDELFRLPGAAARLIYPVSRLVLDPERFTDDAQEVMAARGMGAIYTRTSRGTVLREPPAQGLREEWIARFHAPHHRALAAAVQYRLSAHGHCLIVDCHSFASAPLPYELDQDPSRPEICIGTDPVHTPPALTELATSLFRSAGLTVAVNRPFAGSLVPASHYRLVPAVHSIMIEVNRALYMDERTGAQAAGFGAVASLLASVLARLREADSERSAGAL